MPSPKLVLRGLRDGWVRSPTDTPPDAKIAKSRLSWSTGNMHRFELRPVRNGFELRGGQLSEPMIFLEDQRRPAIHLVGFLSQKDGSELLIFNGTGEVIETRRYEPPVAPLPGAVGGLHGPTRMTK